MNQETRHTVLVVDDDPASLKILFHQLRQAGFKVLTAEKGASALKRVARARPDMILLDVNLPDIDGFELCRRLQDYYPDADIPVMFLTALSDIANKLKGLNLNAVDYLTKPFQPEEVVARVEKHVMLQHLRQRLEEKNAQLQQANDQLAREIAERQRVEETLREHEASLKEAQRLARIGSWDLDLLSGNVMWSEELYHILQVDPGTTLHLNTLMRDLIHPDDMPMAENAIQEALATGELRPFEFRVIRGDNEERVLWCRGKVFYNPHGEPARLVGIDQDITERKRMEEALQESEEKSRFLIENAGIQISYYTVDGDIISYNKAAADFMDSTPDALQGKNIKDLFPEEVVALHHERVQRVIESEAPIEFEDFVHMPDGDIWLYTNAKKIHNAEGEIKGILVIASDITARKMAEEQLHKAKQDALEAQHAALEAKEAAEAAQRASEAANRAKSVFLANMGHELRTPLHGILGFAQRLEQDATLTETQHQRVGIIYRNGEYLLTLLNDILDFTKIEANTLKLHPSRFALRSLLAQLADMSRLKAEQKGLTLVYDISADVPHFVYSDQKRLRQILLNLLENAIKFTEQGKVSFRVHECNELDSAIRQLNNSITQQLHFEISDTGIGIASEHLETIFQPFQQADPQQLQEGSRGLGLAISRRFVYMMGGQLHVTSTVGEGSTFWFEVELPVIDTPVTDVPYQVQEDVSEHLSQETLATALAALPAGWLATLRQGAADVDPEALSNIIARIRSHDLALAKTLVHLAEEFEYDEILRLIQQTGKGVME